VVGENGVDMDLPVIPVRGRPAGRSVEQASDATVAPAEDRITARSDEASNDQKDDAQDDLALEELNHSDDRKDDCRNPQDECHAWCYAPALRSKTLGRDWISA
jgi:hypothetical protein